MKNKLKGKNRFYSISRKLKKEKKISEDFEVMLNGLTLEEVIALKLEAATKATGGKYFGFPIWHSMRDVVKDAVLKYALSACQTKAEAANFLGLSVSEFRKLEKKYKTSNYFE
tara:strand:+ start:148 stop:486 length:339 start_codon:yes stop_codon:yes gene_type:complete